MGDGLSVSEGQKLLVSYGKAIDAYNLVLKTAADANNKLLTMETAMKEFNKRTLGAIGANYGDNSSEYELAGGIRRSERKKAVRRLKPPQA